MARIEVTRTELVWLGKYDENGRRREVERARLPFQVIERINESRATREANKLPKQASLFDIYEAKEGNSFEDGWRNKLIWGDNLLVMGSLLENFAGKIDLIYIDPPFATGADFSFTAQVGDDDLEIIKDQSIIEEKAYRDTWGRGLETYLNMMADRLLLMTELLSASGSLYVHVDDRVAFHLKHILDELLGEDNFRNAIIWHYSGWNKPNNASFMRRHDQILYYTKGPNPTFFGYGIPYSSKEEYLATRKQRLYRDENGREYTLDTRDRGQRQVRVYVDEALKRGKPADDVWDIDKINNSSKERLGYDTQKPETLLERVVAASSRSGSIVADFFCGSGTTLAVAEKLGCRWIGCDLGRFAIHTTRKRLLGIENCKPFEILNLGKYERQYWQGIMFGGKNSHITEQTVYEYLAFILKLYGAQPISGMMHLHGKKGKAMVHIGSVDSPVTIDEINLALDECTNLKQLELHVLGWEWEMGLAGPSNDYRPSGLMHEIARQKGIKLFLLQIPREVMEQQAVEKGDIQFFELAYLEMEVRGGSIEVQLADTYTLTHDVSQPISVSNPVSVHLKDFVIANTELIPAEVREKVKKWSDYIDYWAVDWDFQNDTFMNGWVTYRTRKERCLALQSETHTYEHPGRYIVVVKVVDIFGNDTTQAYDVEVH